MNDVIKAVDHASQQGPLWFVLAFAIIISVAAFFVVRKLYAVNERTSDKRDQEIEHLLSEANKSREAHHATIQTQSAAYSATLSRLLEEQHNISKNLAVVVAQNSGVVAQNTTALTDNTTEIRKYRETQERAMRNHP